MFSSKQGAAINSLMFVLDGKVSVEVEGVGQIASLGSGEVLGEMSLVDESPPSAGVIVVEPTRVLHIDRTILNTKLEGDPAFAARLYRAIAMFLSVRMRSTVQGSATARLRSWPTTNWIYRSWIMSPSQAAVLIA